MGEIIHGAVSQAGGGGSLLPMLGMLGAMFAIMWFIMIRPERKRQQEHQNMLASLKKGDEVVLTSGIFGKIHAIDDKTLVLEIGEKTRVKVLKAAVTGPAARLLQPSSQPAEKGAAAAGATGAPTAVPTPTDDKKADASTSGKAGKPA